MIRPTIAATAALALASPLVATTVHAADCKAEVEAAFEKQRMHAPGYHVATEQYQDIGTVKVSLDYMLPDRMYQGIQAPHEKAPIETIAVARWAWGNMGGGWEELQPQFAQAVTAHVAAALGAPAKAEGSFECLGKQAFEGREFVAYRSSSEAAAAGAAGAAAKPQPVARTIYVDPATGLPAANVVGDAKEGGKLWAKSEYSYPADLKVEAPVNAAPAKPLR